MIRVPDSLLGVIFAIGGVVLFIASSHMEGLGGLSVGPGLMPMLLGVGFAVAGSILAVQGVAELKDFRAGIYRLVDPRPNPWFPIVVLAALILYVPLLPIVGFLPLTFVFVALVVWIGGGSLLASAIFSAVVTAFIYYLFANGLRVPIPMGLFG